MRRNVGLSLLFSLGLTLVLAANAAAQGSVLQVTPQTATAGQTVRVTGTNFTSAVGNSPVSIRLATRNGQELTTTTSSSAGTIDVEFPLPLNIQPGWHLLLAIQTTDSNGRQRSFTPGRTRLRVQSGAAAVPPGGGRGGGFPAPLAIAAASLAVVLLAGGAGLAARRARTANQPQLGSR